jgi:Helix-turn-helix domain
VRDAIEIRRSGDDWWVDVNQKGRLQSRKFPDRAQARKFVGELGRGQPAVEWALRREASRFSLQRRTPTFQQVAVGKSLRLARETRGLSLRRAASLSGGELSPAGLGLIEQGKRAPTLRSLEAIAKATGAAITVDASGVRVELREET